MNPQKAEDKYIFISDDIIAFAYKYKRKQDFYVNLDYQYFQKVMILETHEDACTQYQIFDEGFCRLINREAMENLIIEDGYKEVSLCMN